MSLEQRAKMCQSLPQPYCRFVRVSPENTNLRQNSRVYWQFHEIHECITSSALVVLRTMFCLILRSAIDYQFIYARFIVCGDTFAMFEGRSAHHCVLRACERVLFIRFLLKFWSLWHKVNRMHAPCFAILNFFLWSAIKMTIDVPRAYSNRFGLVQLKSHFLDR